MKQSSEAPCKLQCLAIHPVYRTVDPFFLHSDALYNNILQCTQCTLLSSAQWMHSREKNALRCQAVLWCITSYRVAVQGLRAQSNAKCIAEQGIVLCSGVGCQPGIRCMHFILEHHTAQCLSATHGRERACAHFAVDCDVNLNLGSVACISSYRDSSFNSRCIWALCSDMQSDCSAIKCTGCAYLHNCILHLAYCILAYLQTVCCLLIMHTAVHFYALTLCAECN